MIFNIMHPLPECPCTSTLIKLIRFCLVIQRTTITCDFNIGLIVYQLFISNFVSGKELSKSNVSVQVAAMLAPRGRVPRYTCSSVGLTTPKLIR